MGGNTKASAGDTPWLSKTRFVSGRQCVRGLWWRVREPDAPELVPDATLAERFATGHQVGELARHYVPGGVVIEPEHGAFLERVKATRLAIEGGARVVYEAAFFEEQCPTRLAPHSARCGGGRSAWMIAGLAATSIRARSKPRP